MSSYLNNGYDVMNYFAKFEKFLPHRITIPSLMTFESLTPELDCAFTPPYKLDSQNTSYKLGLRSNGFHGDKATNLYLTSKFWSVLSEKFYVLEIGTVHQVVKTILSSK